MVDVCLFVVCEWFVGTVFRFVLIYRLLVIGLIAGLAGFCGL